MDLEEKIKDFSLKKVLVVGDILLDHFLWGEVERVNPEQPASPLVSIDRQNFMLGGAGNVANNLVALGAEVRLISVIGNDIYGREIKKLCNSRKIKLNYFYHNKTIIKNRIMAHGQQLCRFDIGENKNHDGKKTSLLGKLNCKIENGIFSMIKKEIQNYDVIIFSDYNKYFFRGDLASRIINLANNRSIKTIAAPKPENAGSFSGSYVICVNRVEAGEISGTSYYRNEEMLKQMAKGIYNRLKPKYVIITCGEDGVFSYNNGELRLIRTKVKKVADVTGAGDTFLSALSLGLAIGLDIHYASVIANAAAGVVVEKPGTATATREEVIKYLH